MRRHIPLLVVVLLALTVTPGAAQGNIEVLIPVHGVFAVADTVEVDAGYQRSLNLVDGFTGNTLPIDYDQLGMSLELHWSPDGCQLAIPSRPLSMLAIWRETENLVQEYTLEGTRLYQPVSWSEDGQSVLLTAYTPGAPGSGVYSLIRFEPITGAQTTLLDFGEGDPITDFPLPTGNVELQFSRFRQVHANPIDDAWLLLQIEGIDPAEMGRGDGSSVPETAYVNLTVLWNSQSGATLSLNDLLGSHIGGGAIPWHPDGQRLYIATYDNQQSVYHIIRFDPSSGSLAEIRSTRSSPPATLRFWLGAGALMIGVLPDESAGQDIYYLAELQDSGWSSTAFMRMERGTALDWQLTASGEERRQLACLFDQTLPSQLAVGLAGQVAFTDGTPSRLRSAPDRYSAQVTMMAEGTPFTVLDGPTCMDGYRWWQLCLGDETVGWAAEADTTSYFLEPLP